MESEEFIDENGETKYRYKIPIPPGVDHEIYKEQFERAFANICSNLINNAIIYGREGTE